VYLSLILLLDSTTCVNNTLLLLPFCFIERNIKKDEPFLIMVHRGGCCMQHPGSKLFRVEHGRVERFEVGLAMVVVLGSAHPLAAVVRLAAAAALVAAVVVLLLVVVVAAAAVVLRIRLVVVVVAAAGVLVAGVLVVDVLVADVLVVGVVAAALVVDAAAGRFVVVERQPRRQQPLQHQAIVHLRTLLGT